MKNISVIVIVASIAFMAGAGVTYIATEVSWISDMANQPSIKPQERPFLPPQNSIPTDLMSDSPTSEFRPPSEPGQGQDRGHTHESGVTSDHHEHSTATPVPKVKETAPAKNAPAHRHSGTQDAEHHQGTDTGRRKGAAVPQTQPNNHEHSGPVEPHPHGGSAPMHQHGDEKPVQSGDGHMHGHGNSPQSKGPVVNPIKTTAASVKRGEELFNIYCQVCHGVDGQGGMPMATKIPGIPKFTAVMLRQVSDDHMFTMVTTGHGPMPGYAEALTPEERWHVSNYVRTIQTRLAEGSKQPTKEGNPR